MFKIIVFFTFLISSLIFAMGIPVYEDLETAADDHHGRVSIKVFRGPTEHHGHHHWAPWGYWVKQPADEHHHH